MNSIKIKSETADALADFLAECQPSLKEKLITEGYDGEDITDIFNAYLALQGELIGMLGEESGTSFTVEIK